MFAKPVSYLRTTENHLLTSTSILTLHLLMLTPIGLCIDEITHCVKMDAIFLVCYVVQTTYNSIYLLCKVEDFLYANISCGIRTLEQSWWVCGQHLSQPLGTGILHITSQSLPEGRRL